MEAATAADLTLRYPVRYITLGSAAKDYVWDLTVDVNGSAGRTQPAEVLG